MTEIDRPVAGIKVKFTDIPPEYFTFETNSSKFPDGVWVFTRFKPSLSEIAIVYEKDGFYRERKFTIEELIKLLT